VGGPSVHRGTRKGLGGVHGSTKRHVSRSLGRTRIDVDTDANVDAKSNANAWIDGTAVDVIGCDSDIDATVGGDVDVDATYLDDDTEVDADANADANANADADANANANADFGQREPPSRGLVGGGHVYGMKANGMKSADKSVAEISSNTFE